MVGSNVPQRTSRRRRTAGATFDTRPSPSATRASVAAVVAASAAATVVLTTIATESAAAAAATW